MMEVVAINIPYRKTINDIKYWGEKHSPKGETNPAKLRKFTKKWIKGFNKNT